MLTRFFVSGVTWSVRASSGKTLLVLARGFSFPRVALGCYGFGTVLDLPRWLASRRASSGPARVGGRSCESGKRSFEEFQRVQRCKRESARTQRIVLNCPGLDIAHRRLVQSERRYGAEPRLPGYFFKAHDLSHLIFHSFRERYTRAFISVINMQDAKV